MQEVTQETVVTETIIEEPVVKQEEPKTVVINTREKPSFKIIVKSDTMLRKHPSIKNTPDNICGKLTKNAICNVVSEITFTKIKMYKLDTGCYILVDNKVEKI